MTSPAAAKPRRIFLVAGEPSGDVLGGRLMAALKRATGGGLAFMGVGGERMQAEGLASLFPIDDLAVMGLAEVLPRLPRILSRLRETETAIAAIRPDVVVTIDAPSFTLRLARRVRALKIPVVHYVAPQLWAWRPGRARKLASTVDHLMVILPFEPAFFAKLGVACTYVGHPVVEDAAVSGDGAAFRARHGLSPEAPLIAVLPGSRRGLVRRMLPIFGATIRQLRTRWPDLAVMLPAVAGTAEVVTRAAVEWGGRVVVVRSPEDKRDGYAAATCALTTSGTATLELAVARLPIVVAYRASRLTAAVVRRMIEVPYVALPNLVAGRPVAPELLQENCTPERLTNALAQLLAEPTARQAQIGGWNEVAAKLKVEGASPSERAARVVLEAVNAT